MELIGILFKFANMSYIDVKEVQVQDDAGNVINPVQDETVILLRRIVQILQPIATQDSSQRQRIVVEGGSLSSIAVISSISSFSGSDSRFWLADVARNTYANGIRQNLIFS